MNLTCNVDKSYDYYKPTIVQEQTLFPSQPHHPLWMVSCVGNILPKILSSLNEERNPFPRRLSIEGLAHLLYFPSKYEAHVTKNYR